MTLYWSLLFTVELSAVGSRHPGWCVTLLHPGWCVTLLESGWWVTLLHPGWWVTLLCESDEDREETHCSRVYWDELHGWLRFGRTLPAHCQRSDCSLCTCPVQRVFISSTPYESVNSVTLSFDIKVWKAELGWSHEEELIIKKERGLISSILFIFTKNNLNYISIHRVHSFIQRCSERKNKDKNNIILQRCRKPSLGARWLWIKQIRFWKNAWDRDCLIY